MERSRGVGGVGGFLGIAHDGLGKLVVYLYLPIPIPTPILILIPIPVPNYSYLQPTYLLLRLLIEQHIRQIPYLACLPLLSFPISFSYIGKYNKPLYDLSLSLSLSLSCYIYISIEIEER